MSNLFDKVWFMDTCLINICNCVTKFYIWWLKILNVYYHAGLDGYVKTWFYKFISEQDPPAENPFVFIEPSYQLLIEDHIGKASLLSYAKNNTNEYNYDWFIQVS